jgi:drug/metabolite transporter (DMT)-like permease
METILMSLSLLTPFLLVVGASLGWSALDWVRKEMASRTGPIPFLIVLTAGQAVILLPFILSGGGAIQVAGGYWLPGLASLTLNILANWLFMRAVAVSPLSLTVPYLALTPVFTTLLAIPLLREVPTALQGAGVVLTVAGALMLNPDCAKGVKAMATGFWRERGSAYMAMVALLWSLASPLDKLAMMHASPTFHGLVLSAGLPLAFLAILVAQGKLATIKEPFVRPGVMAVGVVAGAGALLLQLSAMQLIYVGLVESIKRVIGIAMAAVVGRLFFQEPITRQKAIALALMALGVVLILIQTRG